MNTVFKQHLKVFLKEYMNIDERFMHEIDGCKDYSELMDFLGGHGEHIAGMLELELAVDCKDCEDKDDEISDLEDQAYKIALELEDAPEFKTMDEERKFEAFMEHHHKYNATEMDELLK